MSKEHPGAALESQADFSSQPLPERRDQVAVDFTPYYQQVWDCHHIADVEANREELHETDGRSAAQLLECADIDAIVDTMNRQITVQEKVITSTRGDSLSLKAENSHPRAAPEATRLKRAATDSAMLYPNVIALAEASGGEISWVRLIDTDAFVAGWLNDGPDPRIWTGGGANANTKLFFDPREIDDAGATIHHATV